MTLRLPVLPTRAVAALVPMALLLLGSCGSSHPSGTGSPASSSGIHKIRHVVVILQENRSFDTYFGTFPGADGIPMHNGTPAVCVPDPRTGGCDKPFVDHADVNGGGPVSAGRRPAQPSRRPELAGHPSTPGRT